MSGIAGGNGRGTKARIQRAIGEIPFIRLCQRTPLCLPYADESISARKKRQKNRPFRAMCGQSRKGKCVWFAVILSVFSMDGKSSNAALYSLFGTPRKPLRLFSESDSRRPCFSLHKLYIQLVLLAFRASLTQAFFKHFRCFG